MDHEGKANEDTRELGYQEHVDGAGIHFVKSECELDILEVSATESLRVRFRQRIMLARA